MSEKSLWLAIVKTAGGNNIYIVPAKDEKNAVFQAMYFYSLSLCGGCSGDSPPYDEGCAAYRISSLPHGELDFEYLVEESSKYYVSLEELDRLEEAEYEEEKRKKA